MASPDSTALIPRDYRENRSYIVSSTAITFIVLLTIATVLRIWSRHLQKTRWNWADILMPCSLIFNIAICVQLLLTIPLGIGAHIATSTKENIVSFTKISFLGVPVCYLFAVTLPKLAILDLYLHIFTQKKLRYITYICGFALTISLLINVALTLGQCQPVAKAWDPAIKGHCHNVRAHWTWSSMINIITDGIMLLLPIPMVVQIQQTWRVKFGILVSFLVGNIGFITSIMRLIAFEKWKTNNPADNDPTFTAPTAAIWTIIEPSTYHLAACLLTYRTLLRWMFRESPVRTASIRVFAYSPRTKRSKPSSKVTRQGIVETTMRPTDQDSSIRTAQKLNKSLHEIEMADSNTKKTEHTVSTAMQIDHELGTAIRSDIDLDDKCCS